ncbi:hypothetical protein H8446_12035 [Enterococcus faecalis]|nr:hypothetical protein H8446_12035 [Enterococcus faecalis]
MSSSSKLSEEVIKEIFSEGNVFLPGAELTSILKKELNISPTVETILSLKIYSNKSYGVCHSFFLSKK